MSHPRLLATTVAIVALVAALASTPAAATDANDFYGHSKTIVAAVSTGPVATYLPCEAGEGLIGPRGQVDPCMVVAAEATGPATAYYVCEAGEGLIGPRGQSNECRTVAGVGILPDSYYPCDGSDPAMTRYRVYSC